MGRDFKRSSRRHYSTPRRLFAASTVAALSTHLMGCSLFTSEPSVSSEITALTDEAADVASLSTESSSSGFEDPNTDWLSDGLIAIARPVPAPSSALALNVPAQAASSTIEGIPVAVDSTSLLGFMPLPPGQAALWLSIDTSHQTISLMRGASVISSTSAEGSAGLKHGVFELAHKQTAPLWHAPAKYFEDRGLPVPSEGDRARLRKGALGDIALFLDKDTPIHSGPIWSSDVGGVRVNEDELRSMYEQLDIGAKVEVR